MGKKITKYIKLFVGFILGAAVFVVIATLLIHYKIVPINKFTADFESFTSLKEAFHFGISTFFILLLVLLLTFFVCYAFSLLFPCKEETFICPNCEEVETLSQNQNDVLCKKCGVKLVPLKGFYERKKEQKDHNPKG